MGAYSTVNLTRQEAINYILASLDDASDHEVAAALFALVGEQTINNYSITTEVSDADAVRLRDPNLR